MMINDLTKEQEKLINDIVEEYEKRVLCGDDSYDNLEIANGIGFIYKQVNIKLPKIVICDSPMQMAVLSNLDKGQTFDCIGNGYDSGWTAFYDFMERIGVVYDKDIGFTEWKNFITKSGVFATVLCRDTAFVCIRPCAVHLNSNGQLHHETEMAIKWKDGYGEYLLNGVFVEKWLIETPGEKIDPQKIINEKNAEVRREIVRKIGIDRVCQKLNAEIIDNMGDYKLLNLDIGDDLKRPYLKMKNPSIDVWHIEGVPPGIKTVAEALKWRNGGLENSPFQIT